jgi:hypothetical protein
VGGKVEFRKPNSTNGDPWFKDGDIRVNQMYVEYQVPDAPKYKYPIVLMHGGGHTGAVFRTTPDGREGWFTSFTRRGFAVYVVDAPNRGRTGWDPTLRYAVTMGQKPTTELEPSNIYSAQASWTAFRWGPEYKTQFPGQLFPVEHMHEYLAQVVPSYRGPAENDLIAEDLQALLKRIGPSILLGWSTGVGNVMTAAAGDIERVKGIVGVEPNSADMASTKLDEKLVKVPLLSIMGDNISPENSKKFTSRLSGLGGNATTVSLPEAGIKGNGHVMMLEKNSEQIAELIEQWISKQVPN